MSKAICLKASGGLSVFKVRSDLPISSNFFNNNLCSTLHDEKEDTRLKIRCNYFHNGLTVSLYARKYGDGDYKNRNTFPPPLHIDTYYGDAYLIAHKDDMIRDFDEHDLEAMEAICKSDIE